MTQSGFARCSVRVVLSFGSFTAAVALVPAARATVYTDTTGDQAGTDTAYVDIASVQVTNDASNIYFQINLAANIDNAGVTDWGNCHIGIDSVPGGSTGIVVPWGQVFGLSSGMDFWLGSWVNFGGGSELQQYSSGAWTSLGAQPVTLAPQSLTITIPLASLGLGDGSSFIFDVWSTFGVPGGQSAYDALSNPSLAVAEPWNGVPYDSSTAGPGGTPLVSTYTVTNVVTSSNWNVNASGNWSNPANWSGGVPNAPGAVANFGSVITAPRTVTLDAPMTVGVINFDNANSYTISGTSTLTIDATS
ncbi:MAG TPA: hypothetical protein VNL70_06330, partial [Tepidisphaeraceae bacterium]|nr:hypothetical protein [Tepidisphaeraceae bacterium]